MNWADYSKHLIDKCKRNGIPNSVSFELTPLCNFSCNMCYIRLSPEQMKKQGQLLTTSQWLHLAEETKRLGTLGLEVTGGEPLTRTDFPVLYEAFVKMGYIVSLRSNGYLLQGKLLNLISTLKPRYVSVTLYGASDETYGKVCGVKDGFSTVSQNVIRLRDAGVLTNLTVTLTKENLQDKERLLDWANSHDFHISFYGGLLTPIRSAKRTIEHLRLNYDINSPEAMENMPIREVENREKYMHPFAVCRDYGTRFCITWDGRMTLCSCFPSIWTDPIAQGVGEAFKTLYEKLEAVKRPAECLDCQFIDYCNVCPTKLLSETGDYEKTCDSLCRKAKIKYLLSTSANLESDTYRKLYLVHKEGDAINED